MRRTGIVAAYLALLSLSLIIPAFHHFRVDAAIENTRMVTGFLPVTALAWKWIGELACVVPIVILGIFVLSWQWRWLGSARTLLLIAFAQCLFTMAYALFCSGLLAAQAKGALVFDDPLKKFPAPPVEPATNRVRRIKPV